MLQSDMAFEIVWNGATVNYGEKGGLLPPRPQHGWQHSRARALVWEDLGLTDAELEAAVARLNDSLTRPLAWTPFARRPAR